MSHPCCCVLVERDGEEVECVATVLSDDQPFCRDCEDRHPGFPPQRVVARIRRRP